MVRWCDGAMRDRDEAVPDLQDVGPLGRFDGEQLGGHVVDEG